MQSLARLLLFPRHETTHYRKRENQKRRKIGIPHVWHPSRSRFPIWIQRMQRRKRGMCGGLPQYRWHGSFLQCAESADRKNKIVFQG